MPAGSAGLPGLRQKQRRTSRRHAKIGQDLGRVPAFSLFGDAQLLLALVAEPGGDPGQAENRDQRRKGARASAQIKNEATDRSGQCARVGDSAQPAGERGEKQSQQTRRSPSGRSRRVKPS